MLDVENLRLHYAQTLEHWLARFEAARETGRGACSSRRFVRAWRLYLAGSQAAFRGGQLQLFQVLFQRSARQRACPGPRAYLYAAEAAQAMRHADVLIVGGGPAGSTCAWALRRGGHGRARARSSDSFPRDKVCAGWITPAVLRCAGSRRRRLCARASDAPADPRLPRRPDGHRRPCRRDATTRRATVSYGIRRCEFDDYLLRARARACSSASRVVSVRRGQTTAGCCQRVTSAAPLLVGAGGHFCPVARELRGSSPKAGSSRSGAGRRGRPKSVGRSEGTS